MSRRSRGAYPKDWPAIARRVKDEAGGACVRCGHGHDVASGYVLTVHHLDGDKSNCEWWNLAALCQRCHLSIQARVDMERVFFFEHSEWFKPYVAGFYAHRAGKPDDRSSVLARLDEYLRLWRCDADNPSSVTSARTREDRHPTRSTKELDAIRRDAGLARENK